VPYSPLGRGFLTGALDVAALSPGDWRRGNPRFQGEALAQNRRLADAVAALAAARGCTSAQLALAWLLSRRPDVVPIPGTRSISRLDENAAGAGLALSADERSRLDDLLFEQPVAGERYPAAGLATLDRG